VELAFNQDKCSVLQLGRNNAKHVYTFNSGKKSMELNLTSEERDLSIIIDSELDFESIYSKLLEKQIVS